MFFFDTNAPISHTSASLQKEMTHGYLEKPIFAQLMDFLPVYEFHQCVQRYNGHYKIKSFSCWDQFLCMAFAQLTYRESLRDIEACLRSTQSETLSYGHPRQSLTQYPGPCQPGPGLANLCRLCPDPDCPSPSAFMPTIPLAWNWIKPSMLWTPPPSISVCRSFPGPSSANTKAPQISYASGSAGSIPSVVIITHGKVHDVNILDRSDLRSREPSISWIEAISISPAFTESIKPRPSLSPEPKAISGSNASILSPSTNPQGSNATRSLSSKDSTPRKIIPTNCDESVISMSKQNKRLVFLNQQLYSARIDHRRAVSVPLADRIVLQMDQATSSIKAFYGTNENAVKTQIWIAISVYVLVAIVKKRLNLEQSLYTILQILSVTLFEKTPILQALVDASTPRTKGVTS